MSSWRSLPKDAGTVRDLAVEKTIMNNSEFHAYKTEFRAIIRKVLAESEQGRLDEAGFPAYSHPNPLINWLFWQRLRKVMDYLEVDAPYEHVLDFGCGSGVMLPFLCRISARVTALDIDLLPFERVRRLRAFPANLQVNDAREVTLSDLPKASFDRIIATDVLEHVDDLPGTLAELRALLKPSGQVIISGPTENFLYQIGRKLAGPEYSGDYHERGILEVRKLLGEHMQVIPIATLYWPTPLFDVFAGQK
jgi:2-polyprenyl-3-methyl-5-hydroxy-6-metoxy-1,4-benzoquinol methylase